VLSPMWISGALGVLVIIGLVILMQREARSTCVPPCWITWYRRFSGRKPGDNQASD